MNGTGSGDHRSRGINADASRVAGRLLLDLGDLTVETGRWDAVASRFEDLRGSPAGIDVVVRVPPVGISFVGVFRGWDDPPARLNYLVEGPTPWAVQAAVTDLRRAIDSWIPPGEIWPDGAE